jgi:hypothetical protein
MRVHDLSLIRRPAVPVAAAVAAMALVACVARPARAVHRTDDVVALVVFLEPVVADRRAW